MTLLIELEYDDDAWHSGAADQEAAAFFVDALLTGQNLFHNNEPYGDTIGQIKVLRLDDPRRAALAACLDYLEAAGHHMSQGTRDGATARGMGA
jgi:hypothetical protein